MVEARGGPCSCIVRAIQVGAIVWLATQGFLVVRRSDQHGLGVVHRIARIAPGVALTAPG